MKTNAFYIRALLGVVAVTALVIVLFGPKSGSSSDAWLSSSFNAGPRGHKALYTTLEDLHWPVGRWQGSMRELSGTNQVLLLARNTLGRRYPLQPLEIEQLLNWVSAGNTLILLGDFAESADAKPLLETIGFRNLTSLTTGDRLFEQGSEMLTRERPELTLFGSVSYGKKILMPKVEMEQSTSLPPLPPQAFPFLSNPFSAQRYGMIIPHAKGSVLLVSSASLIDNTFLQRAQNWTLVLWLLHPDSDSPLPEKIWFEEAHHGYRTTFALTDLFQQPGVQLASAQIAFGLLVFLSSQLVRFGPVRPLHRQTPRSTLEFVHSLANLYRRADIRNDIVRSLFRDTHHAILRRFNLPPETSHEVIAQQLKETFPQLPPWRKLAQRFDSNDYVQGLPPTGWLKVSRELILIKNTML